MSDAVLIGLEELAPEAAKQVTNKMRRDLSPALNAVWKC